MSQLIAIFIVLLFTNLLSAHSDQTHDELPNLLQVNSPAETQTELDLAVAQIQFLGNASIRLANRPIELEIKNNIISWVYPQSSSDSFAAYLNQGVAFLHVFHYIDALRSFKMARHLNPNSLYPVTGLILSYLNLSNEESFLFIEQLLSQTKELKTMATQRELLWFNLAVSIFKSKSGTFSTLIDPDLKPLDESYNDLLKFDSNDIETLTLATFAAGYFDADKTYLKALSINPQHTGANHYLVHYYEYMGKSSQSIELAKTVAAVAFYNGHAVHMYGHVLPEVGKWSEAKEKFIETDRLHKDWAKRNEVEPSEDWNYAHNLHLLAVTTIGLGDIKEGMSVLETACRYDSRACLHQYSVTLAFSKIEDTESAIKKLLTSNPGWQQYLQDIIDEIALLKNTPFTSLSSKSQKSEHLVIVSEIVNAKNMSHEDKKVWLKKVTIHIQNNFPQRGFDSWSLGLLHSIRLLSAAARTQDQQTYNALLAALQIKANEFNFDLYGLINN